MNNDNVKVTVLGIDLAKQSFQLHGVDKQGKPKGLPNMKFKTASGGEMGSAEFFTRLNRLERKQDNIEQNFHNTSIYKK